MTAQQSGLPTLPHLPGIVTADQIVATAGHIASEQHDDGLVPWFGGHHADPWDHVEGAMAMTVAGLVDEARRAFAWSATHQRADGSWPMETVGREVRDGSGDANQCAYVAVGVWHHWLVTGDERYVRDLWPVVRRAVQYVLALQQDDGGIVWSRDPSGVPATETLLTGSACMVLALRCATALAELVGDPQPDWELATAHLAHAVARHPDRFADRSRFSMDWYYPVLGGAVGGHDGRELLARRWDEFVVAGRGIRCVADRPWVTAAETCELALALDSVGDRARALALLRDVQFLRADTGGYWTGWVFPEDVVWPREQSTWTGAAVVLAADALSGATGGSGLFRGAGLPALVGFGRCGDRCLTAAP